MDQPFEIDFDRETRLGFPEIIYGASKSTHVLQNILKSYLEKGQNALVTKLQPVKIDDLAKSFPNATVDKESGVFLLELDESVLEKKQVAVISAGSSDAYVVNEVYYTLAYLGIQATCVSDVGVAGVHRLLKKVDRLKQFKVLIVVAGFEGALPTVVGGLLPQPIVAIPTSVGYGVAEGGQVALNTMLSSCANGISVVNIDNGYGAAMAAFRILSLIRKG